MTTKAARILVSFWSLVFPLTLGLGGALDGAVALQRNFVVVADESLSQAPASACKRGNPKPCFDAANHGDLQATVVLGDAYSEGDGVPKDSAEAVKWWRIAADKGVAEAQSKVGYAYYTGIGAPQDYDEATKWLKLAADQGEPRALVQLGNAYRDGLGFLGRSYQESVKQNVRPRIADTTHWHRALLAFEKADDDSNEEFFVDIVGYPGFPENFHKSLEYIKMLGTTQHRAAFLLGAMHAVGLGVERDHVKAAMYYKSSAEAGVPGAMYSIASAYMRGKGVDQNDNEAYFWFVLYNKYSFENHFPTPFINEFERTHDLNAVNSIKIKANEWMPGR